MSTPEPTPADDAVVDDDSLQGASLGPDQIDEDLPGFRALPDPDDFPYVGADAMGDEGDARSDEVTDLNDVDELNVASEVTAEDLGSEDLIDNGLLPEDIEQSQMGIREFEADLADPRRQETIDDRIRQEEPDPASDIVPRD